MQCTPLRREIPAPDYGQIYKQKRQVEALRPAYRLEILVCEIKKLQAGGFLWQQHNVALGIGSMTCCLFYQTSLVDARVVWVAN
jgi:hypothetical protein